MTLSEIMKVVDEAGIQVSDNNDIEVVISDGSPIVNAKVEDKKLYLLPSYSIT